ncbi:hypothetical protein E2C01_039332 [Portunus trituberculatus]|uniref:Uncharacterized protein n=1 Tax=Portunus trituberculatus TaxID=210409 RepID=A0A5B7FJE6_PORTR|nr:hypothetical protein [Portunus trituberculatus]
MYHLHGSPGDVVPLTPPTLPPFSACLLPRLQNIEDKKMREAARDCQAYTWQSLTGSYLRASAAAMVSTGSRHFSTVAVMTILAKRGGSGRSNRWWPSSVTSSHPSSASML